jgi:hypothetical protein
MSRSGYTEDDGDGDQWGWIRWRGAVASAIRGKRGQAFLREMLASMEALPEPKLVAMELEADGQVCAIGSVGRARGIDMSKIDPEDYSRVATVFGINEKLAQEIVWMNDDAGPWKETDDQRFERMRRWVTRNLVGETAAAS